MTDEAGRVQHPARRIRHVGACLCALLLLHVAANADGPVRHLGREQGLDLFSVTSLSNDPSGFLWISGQDGLVRFDGYKFERLESLYPALASEGDKFIWSIRHDGDSGLWLAARDGLSRIDLRLGNVLRPGPEDKAGPGLSSSFTTILSDGDNVWLGTAGRGLWKFHRATGRLTQVPGPEAASQINSMALHNGVLWMGTGPSFLRESGHPALLSYNPAKGLWAVHPAPRDTGVSALTITGDDRLWIGTFGAGLYPYDLKAQALGQRIDGIPDHILAIQADHESHLWVGTQKGLFKLSVHPGSSGEPNAVPALAGANVSSLHLDDTDNLWIGTWSRGLYQINLFDRGIHTIKGPRGHGPLANDQVLSMVEGKRRELWVALWSGGVQRWQPASGWTSVDSGVPGRARQLAVDTEGHLWLGTDQAIGWFDPDAGAFKTLHTAQDSDCAANVLKLLPDKTRGMWVGSRKGGLCYYPSLLDKPMHPLQRFHDQGVLPQHVAVDALWQARSGQLWIGTESYGLLTYSPTSRTLEHWQAKAHPANRPTMQSNFVTDIVGDNRGRLWIATEGGGLHQALFDRSGKLTGFRAITRDDGLASGAITGILAVDDNEIWLSTTAGLTRYRPDSGTVKNFSVSNSFYNGSRFRTSSGELLFGGTEGLTRFFPGKVALNPHVPKVVITGVRLANRPVYPSPDGPVTTPFPFAERVTVPYNKNMLVISFSALDFSNPAKNLYRYRLEGFDRNWIDTDAGNRQAVYTNLEPGRYRFRVIASNSDGLWNQAGSQLNVVVLGPPWSSQWMRFGLIFFLVLAAGVTFWEFRQRQRLRSQHLRSLSESEERLSLALWASGDEFWDWNMRSGETVRMNELPLNVFPRHLLLEQPEALRNFVHEADVPSLLRSFLRHRAGKDLFFECTYRLRDFDEHWHWVQDRGKIVTWSTDGEPERMLGTMKDINTLKRTEEELGIVAKSLANISDAVWITDEDFTLVFVNKAFCRLTGRTEQEAIGASLRFAHVHNQDETFEENIKRYLRNEGKWQGELWEQGIEGDIFPIALTVDSVRNRDGETTHFIGVFSDISQEKQSEQQLRQLAEYDRLTGLYSHAKFLQELERRMAESEFRRQTQMALVMVSLDDFKNINDTFGMDTGDQVLTTVGRQLATLDDDLVCLSRFSGDEFCGLLLSPGQRDRLMEKAGTILKALKAPLNVDGREIRIAASMGLALFPDHATSPLALFEKAHAAMSHLKRAGGNGIQIFNEALEMRARFGSQLDTELRHAINHGELEVHANPRVDLATGKWIAAEVHLRWRSPKRGLLAASSFMPVAEQSGLVYDLAAWFIERLAELVDSMGSMSSGMPLAIPVLSGNVLKTDIFEPVVQNLKTRNIPLDHMEFIIPEHAMVAAHFSTQRCLELFLGEGIKVQVSAFGSTISTLDWVKGQWLSSVRLGRALVAGIGLHPAHDAAIQTLTGFAHAMQLPLQADGIETDQQVTALRTLGCDWGAGPLLGDALPIEDFLQALRRRQQGG